MNLRPRQRPTFSGFSKPEVQKMEELYKDSKEQPQDEDSFKKLAGHFNRSSGCAGKPVVKWTEVQKWFLPKDHEGRILKEALLEACKKLPKSVNQEQGTENSEMTEYLSKLEFEARSPRDGAWYDVDTFLSYRFLSSGDIEVHVRYVGFGSEEDEWLNVRTDVRERSIPLEHSECYKVKVGDLVVCYQERQDQAIYYDAHVVEIRRRCHDIRGCRCLFLIKYDHDNTEERLRLRRLCCRPSLMPHPEEH